MEGTSGERGIILPLHLIEDLPPETPWPEARRILIERWARAAVDAVVNSGKLTRLDGGRIIETDRL